MAIPALSLPDPRTVHPYGTVGVELYRSDFGDHDVRVVPGSKYGIDVNIVWSHRGLNNLWHEYAWSMDNACLEVRTTKFNYEKTSYSREKDRLTAKATRLIAEAEQAVRLDRLLERLRPRIMQHLCQGALEIWRCAAIDHQYHEAAVAAENRDAVATYRKLQSLVGEEGQAYAALEHQYSTQNAKAEATCRAADEALHRLSRAEQRLMSVLSYTREHFPRLNLPIVFDSIELPPSSPRL